MICERIQYELERRIITPYLTEHFWWMGNDDEPMCNWTPWCTQNALLAAFILPHSDEIRKKILQKAFYSLDCFLKDYGEDGCCSEGAEYYRHAGLTFYNACDIINSVTDKLTESVYDIPKIKNIAEYILNMNIPHSEYFFNFADCSPRAGKSGAREFLFGKAVHSDALCSFAVDQWKASSTEEKLFNLTADKLSQSNMYYTLQSIFADREILEGLQKKTEPLSRNIWYESTGVFIVHKGIFSVASKAGNNADSHNHNDTGSFIIYKNGEPFIIDVGVENYTQKTFSPQRYEIWTMQSAYHDLPELNGIMQNDGKEFRADEVKTEENSISMNIAKAYPSSAGIKYYGRKISVSEEDVTINDSIAFNDSSRALTVMNLMVKEKPAVNESSMTVCIGTSGTIKIETDAENTEFSVEPIKITDSRLRRTWPETIYRIRLTANRASQIKLTAK